MKKTIRSFFTAALAFAALLITGSAWAATPVAVWDGDFTNLTSGMFKLDLNSGSYGDDAKSNIIVGSTGGILLTAAAETADGFNIGAFSDKSITVVVKFSDYTYSAAAPIISIAGSQSNRAESNLYEWGIASSAVNDCKGIWYQHSGNPSINNADNQSASKNFGDGEAHTMVVAYSSGNGTFGYVDGTQIYANGGLKGGSLIPYGIGVGGLYKQKGNVAIAAGMRISAIAIFDSKLGDNDIAAFKFASEMTEYVGTFGQNVTNLSDSNISWTSGGEAVNYSDFADKLATSRIVLKNTADVTFTGNTATTVGKLVFNVTGTLTFTTSTAINSALGYEINSGIVKAGHWNSYGQAKNVLTVNAGATLDNNGQHGGTAGYKLILNGGTYSNSVNAQAYGQTKPVTMLCLTADSKITASQQFGLVNNNWGATYLVLNDYALTKEGSADFQLENITIGGTGKLVLSAGSFSSNASGKKFDMLNATFEWRGGATFNPAVKATIGTLELVPGNSTLMVGNANLWCSKITANITDNQKWLVFGANDTTTTAFSGTPEFTVNATTINNLNYAMILNHSVKTKPLVVKNLSGNAYIRDDYGTSADENRYIDTLQTKDTTYAGSFTQAGENSRHCALRVRGETDATSFKSLTLTANSTTSGPLEILTNGKVVFAENGSWSGAVSLDGTSCLETQKNVTFPSLTLEAGATLVPNGGVISVTALTLPEEGVITIDATNIDPHSNVEILSASNLDEAKFNIYGSTSTLVVEDNKLVAKSADTKWIGATDSDWNKASNWDNGVPTADLTAVIPNAAFGAQITVTADSVAKLIQCDAMGVSIEGVGARFCDIRCDAGLTLKGSDLLSPITITGEIVGSGMLAGLTLEGAIEVDGVESMTTINVSSEATLSGSGELQSLRVNTDSVLKPNANGFKITGAWSQDGGSEDKHPIKIDGSLISISDVAEPLTLISVGENAIGVINDVVFQNFKVGIGATKSDDDKSIVATKVVAEVNGVKYATVDAALNAIADNTETTVTILASQEEQTITIPANKVVKFVNADGVSGFAGGATIAGSGTIKYCFDHPTGSNFATDPLANKLPLGLTDSANWTGTFWLRANSAPTTNQNCGWYLQNYGNANSTIRFSGICGFLCAEGGTIRGSLTANLELMDDGLAYAWRAYSGSWNGWENITSIKGDGKIFSDETTMCYAFADSSGYNGSIETTAAGFLFGGTLSAGDTTTKITVAASEEISIAAGKTWTATGGIVVNGTIVAGVSTTAPFASTVTGSGEIVFDGAESTANTMPAAINDKLGGGWSGTVTLRNFGANDKKQINLANFGNKVKLNGIVGYLSIYDKGSYSGELILEDYVKPDETIQYAWNQNDGGSGKFATIAKLSGNGMLYGHNGATQWFKITDGSRFAGSIDFGDTNRSIVFGNSNGENGYAIIDVNHVITLTDGKSWTIKNGVKVSGSLVGSGSLSSNLIYDNGATIDIAAGVLTVNGAVTFNGDMNVKVGQAVGEPVKLISKSGLTSGTRCCFARVFIGEEEQDGVYVIRTGSDGYYLEKALPIEVSGEKTLTTLADEIGTRQFVALNVANGASLNFDGTSFPSTCAMVSVIGSGTFTLKGNKPSATELAKMDFSKFTGSLLREWVNNEIAVGFNFNAAAIRDGSGTTGSARNTDGGIVDAAWQSNDSDTTGNNTALFDDGLTVIDWKCKNLYTTVNPTPSNGTFMQGYLDDGNRVYINASCLPYETYDVIIYAATDDANKNFKAVTVNGTIYTWDDANNQLVVAANDNVTWGSASKSPNAAVVGVNCIRVNGLTGRLSIVGGTNSNNARGCISAIQIMPTGLTSEKILECGEGEFEYSEVENWKQLVNVPTAGNITIDLNGDAIVNLDTAASLSTITVTGEGTLTLKGVDGVTFTALALDSQTCYVGINDTVGTVTITSFVAPMMFPKHVDAIQTSDRGEGNLYTGGAGAEGTVNSVAINHMGGKAKLKGNSAYYLKESANATSSTVTFEDASNVIYADIFGIGTATYNLTGSTGVTTPRLVLSQGADGRTAVLNLAGTAALTVTGTSNVDANTASIMFGHWNGPSTFTMGDSSSFIAAGADVLVGLTRNNQTINLNGGSFTAKGIITSLNATGVNTLNLAGAALTLGETGIGKYGSTTLKVNVNENTTLTASVATLPIKQPITIASGKTLTIVGADGGTAVDAVSTVSFNATAVGDVVIATSGNVTWTTIPTIGQLTLGGEVADASIYKLEAGNGGLVLALDLTPVAETINNSTTKTNWAVHKELDIDGIGGIQAASLDLSQYGKLVYDPVLTPILVKAKPNIDIGTRFGLAAKYREISVGKIVLLTWTGDSLGFTQEQLNQLVDAGTLKNDVDFTVLEVDYSATMAGCRQLVLDIGDYEKNAKTLKIMPLGDSITEGSGNETWSAAGSSANYRVGLMERLAAIGYKPVSLGFRTIKNVNAAGVVAPEEYSWHNGISGQRVISNTSRAGFRESIETLLETAGDDVDVITFKIGTNDAVNNNQVTDAYVASVVDGWTNVMWRIIRNRPTAKIVVGSILYMDADRSSYVTKYNAALKAKVEEMQSIWGSSRVTFVDLYEAVPEDTQKQYGSNFFDNLHPNWLGHGKMADAWLGAITTTLATEKPTAAGIEGVVAKNEKTGAANNVKSEYREGFEQLYVLNAVTCGKFARAGKVPYTTEPAEVDTRRFAKVAYYMELCHRNSGHVRYVWVDMNNFMDDKSIADIPTNTETGSFVVTDLHVDTNDTGIKPVASTDNSVTGFIQFTAGSAGSNATQIDGAPGNFQGYDWNDTMDTGSGYAGVFHIARTFVAGGKAVDSAQMLLNYNSFNDQNSSATEIGIGNFAQHCGQNGTFTLNNIFTYPIESITAQGYSIASIEIWAKEVVEDIINDSPEGVTPVITPDSGKTLDAANLQADKSFKVNENGPALVWQDALPTQQSSGIYISYDDTTKTFTTRAGQTDNGLTSFADYVLNLKPKAAAGETPDKPYIKAAAEQAETGKIKFNFFHGAVGDQISPRSGTGITVKYAVLTADSPTAAAADWKAEGEPTIENSVTVELPQPDAGESAVRYFKPKFEFE